MCCVPVGFIWKVSGLITLVNDNYVDNLKEIFAFVYYDSIVNNLPKNSSCNGWLIDWLVDCFGV